MKKCLAWFFAFVLFAGLATLSYAQDGGLTFPSPWNRSGLGTESPFFGPGAYDSSDSNSMSGLLDLEGFPNNGNNFFGFNDFFDSFLTQPPGQEQEGELLSPFNVSETNGLVTVQTDVVPGIAFDDIGVAVEDNALSINVADTQMTEESGENYTRVEWHRVSVTRTVPLPGEVNSEEMTTDYEDGELTVTLPKDQ
jgi:HSP20 family molecular chaperone IbpA